MMNIQSLAGKPMFGRLNRSDARQLQDAFRDNRLVIVDVDTQYDFMKPQTATHKDQGALYVPGAVGIIGNLKKILQAAKQFAVPVISTADSHAVNDPEFQVFPPHCIEGTPGQTKIPETLISKTPRVITKNPEVQDVPSPDEFKAQVKAGNQFLVEKVTYDVYTNPKTNALLKNAGADTYVFVGVASDICVKAAFQGAPANAKKFVITDAVKAIKPDYLIAPHNPDFKDVKTLTTGTFVKLLKEAAQTEQAV
jgi:nicotinamidase-related amidase